MNERQSAEKLALQIALLTVPELCPDCPTRNSRVELDIDRFVVAIYHDPDCPVYVGRSAWSQRACEEALTNAIHEAGMHQAHYDMADDLILHRI